MRRSALLWEESMTDERAAPQELGELIDRLDNISHALKMSLPNDMHVNILRASLPKLVKEFKAAYAIELGENPWEGEPE
jgi:hypothetical protein